MFTRIGFGPVGVAGVILLLSLGYPTAGVTDDSKSGRHSRGPLVELLRSSFDGWRDSPPPGYVPDAYCTSGPNGGAMGIHFVNGSLIDGVLNAAEPEVLIYEPLPGGRIRLVGVEYFYPLGDPPMGPMPPGVAVNGHLMNLGTAPNRYGIPINYLQLHVWAWRRNPNGTFANWNPEVSCDAYDPNLHPQPDPT